MSTSSTNDISPEWDESADGYETDPINAGTPRLVVALQCHRPMAAGERVVLAQLDELTVGRGSHPCRIDCHGRTAAVFVDDTNVSRQHLAIRRTRAGWRLDDLDSKNGTVINGKMVDGVLLSSGSVIEAGTTMFMFLQDDEPRHHAPSCSLEAPGDCLGAFETLNLDLEQRIRQLAKVAPLGVPLLVRGESGTGKELISRSVHELSGRRGAFVAVNCGALPRELIESELFGHRRGAFSGAVEEREGLVRRADRGTLFLDEIAELPLDSQASLLRVLQQGEVRAVGASELVHVDVRVIAATHQDLQQRIADGRFRHDLYARIAGYEVRLPPLRQRREDLGMLISRILPRCCSDPERVTLHKAAARALLQYQWPRNIRELEHVLQVAVGLSDDAQIRLKHLPLAIRAQPTPDHASLNVNDRALREALVNLLQQARGNIAAVARKMNRAPIQIRRWCTRLNIDVAEFRC
jgi:transcriptional regulator of acetoin/glycerol metabolism